MTSTRISGAALVLGGLTYLVTNTGLTLAVPTDLSPAEVYASDAFLTRLSVATLSVFLLIVGSLGIWARQARQVGVFGRISFGLAFLGSLMTFAHEWAQVFYLSDLANLSPDGMQALIDAPTTSLYGLETALVAGSFMIGWILFSISTLLARRLNPVGPLLLLAGLVGLAPLAMTLPDMWGFIVGNSLAGLGWIAMGLNLSRKPD